MLLISMPLPGWWNLAEAPGPVQGRHPRLEYAGDVSGPIHACFWPSGLVAPGLRTFGVPCRLERADWTATLANCRLSTCLRRSDVVPGRGQPRQGGPWPRHGTSDSSERQIAVLHGAAQIVPVQIRSPGPRPWDQSVRPPEEFGAEFHRRPLRMIRWAAGIVVLAGLAGHGRVCPRMS